MAHGDYNCCAICDCKLAYAGSSSRTKEEICECCLVKLRNYNINITTVDELLEWIKKEDTFIIIEMLKSLNYSKCCYKNDVDEEYDKAKEYHMLKEKVVRIGKQRAGLI